MKEEMIGKQFTTRNSGVCVITKYVGCNEVYVKFLDTGFETPTSMTSLRKGSVKDKTLIHGGNKEGLLVKETLLNYVNTVDGCFFWNDNIGSKRAGKPLKTYAYTVSFKGVVYRYKDVEDLLKGEVHHIVASTSSPEGYSIWGGMVSRCKNKGYAISSMFSKYDTWIVWAKQQKGYKELDLFNKPFNLDSDMFSTDTKTYSEDTCVFIPEQINQIYKTSYKGVEYIGIDLFEGGYRARLNMFNRQVIVGKFSTKDEAKRAYHNKRSEYLNLLLHIYKGRLDDRVVNYIKNDIGSNIFI